MHFRFTHSALVLALIWFFYSAAPKLFAADTDNLLAEDDTSYPCPLKSITEGAVTVYETEPDSVGEESPEVCVFSKKKKIHCLKVQGGFNSSGPSISCSGDTITIFSLQGATANSLELKFDGGKLSQNKSSAGRTALNAGTNQAYEKALKTGDIKAAVAALNNTLYPKQSLHVDTSCSALMIAAHNAAKESLRKKNWAKTTDIFSPAWSWCDEQYHGKLPGSFAKQPNFILALNDYGFALGENHQFSSAETVLKQVLELDRERAVAYLNLGDALAGQKKDAAQAYNDYCRRTQKNKWPKRIIEKGKSTDCKK